MIIPEINHLPCLDYTHVCKVSDDEVAEWGKEHGWVHSFVDPYDWYEEAFGG